VRFSVAIGLFILSIIAGCGTSSNEIRLATELADANQQISRLEQVNAKFADFEKKAVEQLKVATLQLDEYAKISDSRSLGTVTELIAKFTSGDYSTFKVDSIKDRTTIIKDPRLTLVLSFTSTDGNRVQTAQVMMAGSTQSDPLEFEKLGHLTRFPTQFDESADSEAVLDMIGDVVKFKKPGLMLMRLTDRMQIDSYGIEKPEMIAVRVRRRADHEKSTEF
jgi:hypothetical protein